MDMVLASEASTSLASCKLLLLLADDANLLKIDLSACERLRTELEDIKDLLEDAYEKSEEAELSASEKTWLKQTKEVAELVDDAVDEYILKPSLRLSRRPFINFFGGASRSSNDPRSVASKIRSVEALLGKIKEQGQKFRLRELAGTSSSSKTAVFGYSQPRLDCVVGVDSAESELIEKLTSEGGSRPSVISLVGAGGIGKSTLASKVYGNDTVRGHFDFCAWIIVSKRDHRKHLLVDMAKQICNMEGVETMTSQELICARTEFLRPKRYMLVFDAVWDKKFWQVVKDALFHNDQGSRIIITTRSDTVADSCKESPFDHIHRLEPLSKAVSWELFCRLAFQLEPGNCCPPRLKQLSLEIVRMCEGSPLAIVSVAGLLSTKKMIVSEWQRVVDHFYLQFKSDPHLAVVSEVLALSFRDLPYQLKLCFLYFRIFPVGSLIPVDRLVKLWIAEGFVHVRAGRDLEEVAEEYLNELIRRNLVQACEGFDQLEKFCRVNGLMYEMAQQMADKFSFCHILDGKSTNSRGKSRRLSIVNDIDKNVFETIEGYRIRSVFLSNVGSLSSTFMITLFEKCKLLTLLDVENVAFNRLPEEVRNLFHLKYLSLKNTNVKRLPVGKLQNLQTMDVRNTLLVELPIEINMLKNLRHLLASHCHNNFSLDSTQGVRIKEGIGSLKNLQTLMTVEAHFNVLGLIKELQTLRLRRLCISSLTMEAANAICAFIDKNGHLESLSLHSMNGYETLDIQNISSAPALLQRLILKGRLQRFPNWISSLQNLDMLCLCLSRLTDEPLRGISVLPDLVSLWLYGAYEGEQLHFEVGGFQKLKLLALRDLKNLEDVEIDEGALPFLEELRVGPSPLLTMVPSGVQHLRNLKVLAFYDMPYELVHSMQPDGGSEHLKFEHVASVQFWYRVRGRHYALYELGESDLLEHLQGLATNKNDFASRELRLSFCYSNEEEDSASASTSVVPWNDMWLSFSHGRMSFSSDRFSFFSDDIED